MLGELENAFIFALLDSLKCLSGGIGRRAGFKIQFWQQSGGSIPPSGTRFRAALALPKKAKKTHLEFTRGGFSAFGALPQAVVETLRAKLRRQGKGEYDEGGAGHFPRY